MSTWFMFVPVFLLFIVLKILQLVDTMPIYGQELIDTHSVLRIVIFTTPYHAGKPCSKTVRSNQSVENNRSWSC